MFLLLFILQYVVKTGSSQNRWFIYFLFQAASRWLHVVPWGINKLARHVRDKYGNPPVVITENGE